MGSIAERLQVGIIGAGIAGLSAAIAMRKAGWDVEVFEKSSFKNEVGAAITIGCNGTRVLRKWGADFEAWGATENMQVRMPRGDTLEQVWADDFSGVPKKYGERWLFFHRQDLHSGLRAMAEDPLVADTPPARIRLSCKVTDLDCDAGTFKLADGTQVKKDMLIIANGVHCQFVEDIIGRPNPVLRTGKTIYRCLIPMSTIMSNPLTAQLFENQPPGLMGPNIPQHDILCGSYTCRNNTILSLAYVRPTKPEEIDKDDWNSPATLADVEEITNSFHPAIQALPKTADDIKAYNVMLRQEIPSFARGRAVLIGDAAHPMLTTHAQGASISIESTGALQVFFDQHAVTSAEIPDQIQRFNKFRLPRCVTTQIMSNVPRGPASYPGMVERVRKSYDGPLPPPTSKPWSEPFRDFFFSYDVFEESQRFLQD